MEEEFRLTGPIVGRFGGLTFPLNPTDFDGGFTPLDPARSRMAALFASAIRSEMEPIWSKLSGSYTPLSGSRPVETVFEMDPQTHLTKQVGFKYPVLALHRLGSPTWSEYTMQIDKCEQDWNLHYILPNLDIGDTRRIFDVLRIVPEIVRRVIKSRGHYSYENGKLQFFNDRGGIGSIEMTKSEWGQAMFGGQVESPQWLATTMTLHTVEFGSDSADEFGELDSIDWNIGVGDSTGIIPNIIET